MPTIPGAQSSEFLGAGLPNRQTTDYQVSRTRIYLPGLMPVGVAGPDGTPTQFVKYQAAQEWHLVTWTATCESGPPVVPSPIDPAIGYGINTNYVLINMSFGGIIPVPKPDVGHILTMSGWYLYALQIPEGPTAALKLGALPWETLAGLTNPVLQQFTGGVQGGVSGPPWMSTMVIDETSNANAPALFQPGGDVPRGGG
jgi:hypothetical protein